MSWPTFKLGEISKVDWGNTSITKASYIAEGYPAFSASGNDGFLAHAEQNGDGIVLSAIGARCGKCFIAKNSWTAIKNTITIIPDKKLVDINFLFSILNDESSWLTRGAAQPFITLGIAKARKISLPPLAEQQRISLILEKASYIKNQCQSAIENIESQEQSIFTELFGDGQSILKNWPNKNLGELLDFMTSGSRGWAAYYADHGEKFLRIQNVANNELNFEDIVFVSPPESAEANRTTVKAGDILLSITADLGRTAVIPDSLGKAYINQHLAILRTNKISPIFLSGFLSSPCGKIQIQSKNRGGVKAGLNFNDIRSFVIPIPDSSSITKYENYLSKVRVLKRKRIDSLHKSCELVEAIQYQQFAKKIS